MRASGRGAAERLRVCWRSRGAAGQPVRLTSDSESLGARGIAWPWGSESGSRASARIAGTRLSIEGRVWRARARRVLGSVGWVNGFAACRKRSMQIDACSGRRVARIRRPRVVLSLRGASTLHTVACAWPQLLIALQKTVASRRRLIRIVSCACRSRRVRTDLIIGFGFVAWVGIGSSCAPRAANECFAGRSGRSVCRGRCLLCMRGASVCGGDSACASFSDDARVGPSENTHINCARTCCSRRRRVGGALGKAGARG